MNRNCRAVSQDMVSHLVLAHLTAVIFLAEHADLDRKVILCRSPETDLHYVKWQRYDMSSACG